MEIKHASYKDAKLVHELMIEAYNEYKEIPASSTALDETVQSVEDALRTNEQALIGYINDNPVGTVRFEIHDDVLFFTRLSVHPAERGKGIAKTLLKALEDEAKKFEKTKTRCNVRMSITRNMKLYKSVGYQQVSEGKLELKGISIRVAHMEKELD